MGMNWIVLCNGIHCQFIYNNECAFQQRISSAGADHLRRTVGMHDGHIFGSPPTERISLLLTIRKKEKEMWLVSNFTSLVSLAFVYSPKQQS